MIAQTIIEKYVKKVPAYRKENEWKTFGFPLDRQKITNWHLLATDYVLEPVYQLLKETLQEQEVLHADETTYTVLDVPKATTYYWLYTSGKSETHPIVLYQHELSRKHELPQKFLDRFTGYLHSDAYSAYRKIGFCWSARWRYRWREPAGYSARASLTTSAMRPAPRPRLPPVWLTATRLTKLQCASYSS